MKNIHFRSHGDVNLHEVEKVEGEVVKHKGSFVLAYGEVTGHKHVLTVEKPQDLEIRKDALGNMYFHLKRAGTLDHEEHGKLTVPVGIYKQVQEREYDYFSLKTRKVQD